MAKNVFSNAEGRLILKQQGKGKLIVPFSRADAMKKKPSKPKRKKSTNAPAILPTIKAGEQVLFIGVDPSGRKIELNDNGTMKRGTIGLCVATGRQEIIELTSENFFVFMDKCKRYIMEYKSKGFRVVCVVEQPDGQTVFNRKAAGIDTVGKVGKQNRDLGKNQLASNLIVTFLKTRGCEVYEVTPQEKGAKWVDPKKPDYTLFRKIANYHQEMFNYQSHAIDSYQLISLVMPVTKI